jgi:hypothetical protein
MYSIDSLNDKQKEILNSLREYFGNNLDNFLSTPNKEFRNKAPLYFLLSENYDYFRPYLS